MKSAILFLAIAAFASNDVSGTVIINRNAPPPIVTINPRAKSVTLLNASMPVDHFNVTDTRTWSMRYYANPQHFVKGGPIFIYLGGEWKIQPEAIQGGQVYDMAEEHGGYLIYTEHRYYGESWPTSDFTTPNLKYLTIHQALADVATFVKGIKKYEEYAHSKVVVVGCSYAATMATWLRARYPDIIDAAYASSAPLLAINDFKQYFEGISARIQMVHPTCNHVIREGTAAMEELFHSEDGITKLTKLVKYIRTSCQPVRSDFPYKDYFFNQIANFFAGCVQNSGPSGRPIRVLCQELINYDGTSLDKLAALLRDKFDDCFGDYDTLLMWYSQTSLNIWGYRNWLYQSCNEFGFFQTANSTEQSFGVNWFSNLSHSFCKDAFGEEFTPERILKSIDQTNAYWGGLNPNISKVVSIHGTADPWHTIGLSEDLNEDAPVIIVNGSGHCADCLSITSEDSEEMKNAKKSAKKWIAKWIS